MKAGLGSWTSRRGAKMRAKFISAKTYCDKNEMKFNVWTENILKKGGREKHGV